MKTIYLVLPCFNEEQVICTSMETLNLLWKRLINEGVISDNSRIVFVNDGSTDSTRKLIEEECERNIYFGIINLAHNVGHQNAMLAGLQTVVDCCDAVITLDADLQHDINKIPEFIEAFEKGNDIVYGVRKSRQGEGFFKRVTGDGYNRLMRILGAPVIKNHADYRLMSARAIRALMKYDETNLFLRGIIPQIGYQSTVIEYEEKPRMAGESKYTFGKMMKLAIDGITSFSVRPLEMVFAWGGVFFALSIIMFIYAIVVFIKNGTVPGWTSIVAPIWLLGGIQLLALGVVGEYVGRIYLEAKHRPKYEIESKILHNDMG